MCWLALISCASDFAAAATAAVLAQVPGFFAVPTMLRVAGIRASMLIGTGSQVVQNLLYGLASKTWHFYAIVLATSPAEFLSRSILSWRHGQTPMAGAA